MNIKGFILAVGTLLLACPAMQASTVTISMGTSAENFTLTGQGANSSSQGTFLAEFGTCVSAAGTTTCNLTGTYTGATAGFTAGTYDLVTVYNTGTPLRATEFGVDSFAFGPTDIAAGTTISLDLNDTISGNHDEAIFNGSFVGGFGIGFTSASCTGVSTCSQDNVGLTPGATISGPVSGSASFSIPDAAPVPEPGLLILGGVPGALMMMRRKWSSLRT